MGEKHIVYMTVSAQPIWLRYYYFSRLFFGRGGGVDIHGLGCTPVSMAGNLLILLQLVLTLNIIAAASQNSFLCILCLVWGVMGWERKRQERIPKKEF
jgi:hypothetical protein